MTLVRTIENRVLSIADGRFKVQIKVLQVPRSLKFPDGYKVNCVLIDVDKRAVLLLLDNHQPFGYHVHFEMPHNKSARRGVDVKSYAEAIRFFFEEVRKVVDEKE